jgi:hypothetical protein
LLQPSRRLVEDLRHHRGIRGRGLPNFYVHAGQGLQ